MDRVCGDGGDCHSHPLPRPPRWGRPSIGCSLAGSIGRRSGAIGSGPSDALVAPRSRPPTGGRAAGVAVLDAVGVAALGGTFYAPGIVLPMAPIQHPIWRSFWHCWDRRTRFAFTTKYSRWWLKSALIYNGARECNGVSIELVDIPGEKSAKRK